MPKRRRQYRNCAERCSVDLKTLRHSHAGETTTQLGPRITDFASAIDRHALRAAARILLVRPNYIWYRCVDHLVAEPQYRMLQVAGEGGVVDGNFLQGAANGIAN